MRKILISEAGGAPSINITKSIRLLKRKYHLIGISSDKYLLALADTDEKYLVCDANQKEFMPLLKNIISKTGAEVLFSQNDSVISILSRNRNQLGCKLFLPNHATIELCHDKFKSFKRWDKEKIKVPRTVLINSYKDLKVAMTNLGPKVWLRMISGWSGKAAVLTDNLTFAKSWIDFYKGWGKFTVAEYLSPVSVTWMSLWYKGNLIVAQGRKRIEWRFGHHSISGVTGQTGVAETISDKLVDRVALQAIYAADENPHGIFSVDMTLDSEGIPNPTEINIGRFFATSYFFARAGLNITGIILDILYENKIPVFQKKINPLKPGLIWVRQIDSEPVLIQKDFINKIDKDYMRNIQEVKR